MYAKRFEALLARNVGKTDLSQRAPDDMPQRFELTRRDCIDIAAQTVKARIVREPAL